MLGYTDLYGQRLRDYDDIEKCETEEQLKEIISKHHDYIGDILNDAQNSLDRFEKEVFKPNYLKNKKL